MCAAVVMRAYGRAVGVVSGISAAAAVFGMSCGLSAGNGQPALSGLLVGLVGAVSGWVIVGLFQPAQDRFAVTPRSLLDRDRAGTLTVAGTVGIGCGIVYGIALGPLAGVVVLAAVAVSLTATASVWGRFSVSRVWLALTGMAPLAVMGFLAEAHARGVLRQVGGSYEFRHTELKDALLPAQEAGQAAPGDQPTPIAKTPIEPLPMGGRQRDRGGRLPAGDADTALQERAKTSMRTALTADPALRDKPGQLWNKVRSTYRFQLSDIRDELIADVLAA